MLTISSRPLLEAVTESEVCGQTRISPPRLMLRMVGSGPVVMDEPFATRVPAMTIEPDIPGLTGTTAGLTGAEYEVTVGVGAGAGAGFGGSGSPGAFKRTIRRLPAASHVNPLAVTRSTITRVTGGSCLG